MTAALTDLSGDSHGPIAANKHTFLRSSKPSKIILQGKFQPRRNLRQHPTSTVTTIPGIHQNSENITMSTSELASSYAALILADDGVEITVSHTGFPTSQPRLRRLGSWWWRPIENQAWSRGMGEREKE